MKKKINFSRIAIIVLVFLIIFLLSLVFKRNNILDLNEPIVQELYAKLNNANTEYCDGFAFYAEKLDHKSLGQEQMLCLAYTNLDSKDIVQDSLTKVKKKDYCELASDQRFSLDKEGKVCSTSTFNANELAVEYEKLFGSNLTENADFALSGTLQCYYQEESNVYTCGSPTIQTIEVGWGPITYRMLTNAIEEEEKILLYDYLVVINNNLCYKDNYGSKENVKCSNALSITETIDNKFIKQYGVRYVHTFVEDQDGNYFWESSAQD